ncbi:hypothetical protein TRVA0_018S01772 [Trichomonascus vanleenenianus]|uniref:uncharacterized protein n=1 Tax=Trichomonascus vanleenenianus TaxID=2268995 RepID=UPI003ECB8D25
MSSPDVGLKASSSAAPESVLSNIAGVLHQLNLNIVIGGSILLVRRILVGVLSAARAVGGLLWALMSVPLAVVWRLWCVVAVSPVLWCWKVFVVFFETVVTPIFCFAMIAGMVGAIGGLIVGGCALVVQTLIPVKRPEKPSKKRVVDSSLASHLSPLNAHINIREVPGDLFNAALLSHSSSDGMSLRHRRSPSLTLKADVLATTTTTAAASAAANGGKSNAVFNRAWDKNAASETKSRASSTASISSLLSCSSATSPSLATSPAVEPSANNGKSGLFQQASPTAADYTMRNYMPTIPRDQILSYEDSDGYFDYSPPISTKSRSPELQCHSKQEYVLHSRRTDYVPSASISSASSFATIAEADEESLSTSCGTRSSNIPASSSRTTVTAGSALQ